MKAAFQVSEQHVERFRQASVKIRECLSAVEEQLPPDAGLWREAAIASLLQAYGATIAAIEVPRLSVMQEPSLKPPNARNATRHLPRRGLNVANIRARADALAILVAF